MNNSNYFFALDLDKQDSQEYVTVRRGDTARHLTVTLRESGTPYHITEGAEAILAARKSDGSYIEAACEIKDNQMEITLPASFTAGTGKLTACFRVTEGSAALSSPPFTIFVDEPAAKKD